MTRNPNLLPLALSLSLVLSLLAVPRGAAATYDAEAAEPNPCRPYPPHPDPVTQGWCTAKGIGNATVILAENVLDGNYTTLPEYLDGVEAWKESVLACADAPSNPRCPALAVVQLI